jgi:ATP-dependent helicase/DNAse subunit B
MPPEKTSLMDYQDALLELLSSELSQEAVLETLKTDARFASYQDYIEKFDPDMVSVACELMGKWAKRQDESGF